MINKLHCKIVVSTIHGRTWKCYIKKKRFIILALTWSDKFELADETCFISDI